MKNLDRFVDWINDCTELKKKTCDNYKGALKNIDISSVSTQNDIYDVDDIDEFRQIVSRLKDMPDFIEKNNRQNNTFTAALSQYEKYLIFDKNSESVVWWPSLDEYNPNISKDKWLELLADSKIFSDRHYNILAKYFDNGGMASLVELAEKYNDSGDSIKMSCIHLIERIVSVVGCDLCNQENAKYWPVMFLGRDANKNEPGSYVWKLRPELYEALDEFNILRFLQIESKSVFADITNKEILNHIIKYIDGQGYSYDEKVIANLYCSLKAKPFVILAGISGTGKSKLVKLFGNAIGVEPKIIPVRPDWSDSTDLLGHLNIEGDLFIAGELTEFLEKANKDLERPYILCLDEMNLARVEYYFSDFLSLIESIDNKKTGAHESEKFFSESSFGKDKEAFAKYGNVRITENVYIIGTVNMDETTYPFSKKVLDRANTIELSDIDLSLGLENESEEIEAIYVKNDFLRGEHRTFKDLYPEHKELFDYIIDTLTEVNICLKSIGAEVAFRVRDVIGYYLLAAEDIDLTRTEAMDNCIMQKILPRIQGSADAIETTLEGIGKIAEREKFERSKVKIDFMIKRLRSDGYTSYWL